MEKDNDFVVYRVFEVSGNETIKDDELFFMTAFGKEIKELNQDSINRVLKYLMDRFYKEE